MSFLASPVRNFLLMLLAPIIAAAVGLSSGLAASTPATPPAPAIHFDGSPETGVPPDTLGPYTMTSSPLDTRPLGQSVTTIPAPNGNVGLSPAADHYKVGSGWATWSNGYGTTHGTGAVYFINGTNVIMTMPPDTGAVYFYTESNTFTPETFTATAQNGTTSGPVVVTSDSGSPGTGAKYFGFFGTGGALIQTITLTCAGVCGGRGFAVGEFGDAVGPAGLLQALLDQVQGVGPGHSLAAKVQEALNDVNAGHISDACGTLGAFIHEVNAQTGKTISPKQAKELITAVQQIEAILGC